jgi:hypothetical protein
MTNDLDPLEIPKLLRYEDGKLFWKFRHQDLFVSEWSFTVWNKRYANKEAFTYVSKGYRTGRIYDRGYLAHRVIFCLFYGRWPNFEIDHIDGDSNNNRIENLREVSSSGNSKNMGKMCHNSSGVTGVYHEQYTDRWCASIESEGIRYKKRFVQFDDAVSWRKMKEKEFGFYENVRR